MVIGMFLNITKKFYLCCAWLIFVCYSAQSQDVSIQLGQNEIAQNQYFTISVTVKNDRLKSYNGFPEINGFIKRGTSSSSTTNIINGQISSSQRITQNYEPKAQGNFVLKPFSMEVNGETVQSGGTQITVTAPKQRQRRSSFFDDDPFEEFFGGGRSSPKEFVDVDADAFLAVATDKKDVYVGEGVTATLGFYVSESNRARMSFYDINNQLAEIMKVIKPSSCWEENFPIDQLIGEEISINGKNYTRYKIFQSTFFPLTLDDIKIPSIGLKMLKYRVAKNPSFFGNNTQEDYKTFYSKEKTIKVKPLPDHPLKNTVSVGNFKLKEKLKPDNLATGESFSYDFRIVGTGNISSVNAPKPPKNRNIEIYEPNVRQNINRSNGRISGSKIFSFYGVPNEPGEHELGKYFQWVYFNPREARYDTLISQKIINVTGKSRKNIDIAASDMGDFYDRIDFVDNELQSLNKTDYLSWIISALGILILIATLYFIFKQKAS